MTCFLPLENLLTILALESSKLMHSCIKRVNEVAARMGALDENGATLRDRIDEVQSGLKGQLAQEKGVSDQISALRSELEDLKGNLGSLRRRLVVRAMNK